MNGSRLAAPGAGKSLSVSYAVHVRYQSPMLSMLSMWSPLLSPSLHLTMLH